MNQSVISPEVSGQDRDETALELKPQDISVDVLNEKYAKGSESTIDGVRQRVAHGLAEAEDNPKYWGPVFYEAQHQGVVLAGRINSVIGTDIEATAINCYVQPCFMRSRGCSMQPYVTDCRSLNRRQPRVFVHG